MGIFASRFTKKKFGKEEALRVFETKPDITPEHALTGVAFIAALNIPVTVIPEVEEEIAELSAMVETSNVSLVSLAQGILEAEKNCESLIANFKTKTLSKITSLKEKVSDKVSRINSRASRKIEMLEDKISWVKGEVFCKVGKTRDQAANKETRLQQDLVLAFSRVEEQTQKEITGIKSSIEDIKRQTVETKERIDLLSKIKGIFA